MWGILDMDILTFFSALDPLDDTEYTGEYIQASFMNLINSIRVPMSTVTHAALSSDTFSSTKTQSKVNINCGFWCKKTPEIEESLT